MWKQYVPRFKEALYASFSLSFMFNTLPQVHTQTKGCLTAAKWLNSQNSDYKVASSATIKSTPNIKLTSTAFNQIICILPQSPARDVCIIMMEYERNIVSL